MAHDIIDNTAKVTAITAADDSALAVSIAAYTAGDIVGGLLKLPVHSAGGGGRITDLFLTDAANQSEPYTIHIFDQAPTSIADADAFDGNLTIDDLDKRIKILSLAVGHYTTDAGDPGNLGWAHIPDLSIDFDALDGDLYMYLVAGATPDYVAVTDVKVHVMALLN